jgi:capsular polysaccharide biosynthesis protein
VQDGRWIVIDSTCSPSQNFVAGHWQFLDQITRNKRSIFLRLPSSPKSIRLDEAIYLIGRCDENWFHLIMDTLPRYLFMSKISKGVPVLIRSDLPTTSINFLRRVIPNPLIMVDIDVKVEVKTLYFLAGRSTTFDTSTRLKVPQVDFSPNAISLTRNLILRSESFDSPAKYPQKLYLSRESKYRSLLNSRKIFKTLESAGFQEVEVDQDFFRFQHVFFYNSRAIATPGGAILANMIFMNPESKLIVFRSSRDLRPRLWKKLAVASNVNITHIF